MAFDSSPGVQVPVCHSRANFPEVPILLLLRVGSGNRRFLGSNRPFPLNKQAGRGGPQFPVGFWEGDGLFDVKNKRFPAPTLKRKSVRSSGLYPAGLGEARDREWRGPLVEKVKASSAVGRMTSRPGATKMKAPLPSAETLS